MSSSAGLVLVFAFLRLAAPPATLAVCGSFFYVDFPYRSACVFLQSPFFVSLPARHAGGPREVFDGDLPYPSACVFFQSPFFRVFPGFIA